MIRVNDVSYRYRGSGQDVLHEFSMEIPHGCLFGLLGPNGSGKTTLISLMTGLLKPATGRIVIGQDADCIDHAATRPRVALVPQEYAFYPRLSVRENLNFFAGVWGIESAQRQSRVHFAQDAAGLASFARTRAHRLSGGLKRRLNLAIGLLNNPELLLLDEPTVGIDPQSRHFILESIRRINAEGTTVVYTSHYMEEVETLCTDIGILDSGRLIARGDLQSLLAGGGSTELTLDLAHEPNDGLRETIESFGVRVDGTTVREEHLARSTMRSLLDCLLTQDVDIVRLRYGHTNLESLFLHLTGHQLRD